MGRRPKPQEGVQGGIKVNQAGLDRLSRAIRLLPEKAAGRRVMVGMKRAMRPVRDDARDAVESRSGALRKSIHVVNGKRSKEGNPYVVVRVNPKTSVQYSDGTGATITRVPKTYLHWIIDGVYKGVRTSATGFVIYDGETGRPLRVKKISHPGIDGVDIFGDAFKRNIQTVLATSFDAIEKSIDDWKRKNGIQ
jgi:hypothetical protein